MSKESSKAVEHDQSQEGQYLNVPLAPLLNQCKQYRTTRIFPGVEYRDLRQRIFTKVRELTLPEASVLVASKGDEALLEVEGRRTLHFPLSETGGWAGYNFADSAEATAHMEKLRREGAQYFVLPEICYWWLEYYKEFYSYLSATSRQLTNTESPCVIFDLRGDEPAPQDRLPHRIWQSDGALKQILEMLRLAVPPGSSMLVAKQGNEPLLEIEDRRVQPFSAPGSADLLNIDSAAAISTLQKYRQEGAQYVVFPHTVVWWLEVYSDLRSYLETHGTAVAIEPDVCVIYALHRIGLVPHLKPKRVTAILTVRNEETFIAACLEHHIQQGVQVYLIDNDSTDRTVAIAERYRGQGVLEIERLPFEGVFQMRRIRERKAEVAAALDTDWVMYIDADEFRFAPRPDWTLAQAFAAVEAAGYNAVNFCEFVFIPTQESPDHDHPHFQETMRSYYSFVPRLPWRISAWQSHSGAVDVNPHRCYFPGMRLCPQFFPMKHFHFLSVPYAARKYGPRKHDTNALAAGEHGGAKSWREQYTGWSFALPPASDLKIYREGGSWDLSDPKTQHYIEQAFAAGVSS